MIGSETSGVPRQEDIRLNGHAIQCRITTEDPEENFIPDYGRITAYREATGFGVRLDGGTAYAGAIITRYYDPLLAQLKAAVDERFLDARHAEMWTVVSRPEDVLPAIESAATWGANSRDFAVVR